MNHRGWDVHNRFWTQLYSTINRIIMCHVDDFLHAENHKFQNHKSQKDMIDQLQKDLWSMWEDSPSW